MLDLRRGTPDAEAVIQTASPVHFSVARPPRAITGPFFDGDRVPPRHGLPALRQPGRGASPGPGPPDPRRPVAPAPGVLQRRTPAVSRSSGRPPARVPGQGPLRVQFILKSSDRRRIDAPSGRPARRPPQEDADLLLFPLPRLKKGSSPISRFLQGGEGYCLEDPRPWRGDRRGAKPAERSYRMAAERLGAAILVNIFGKSSFQIFIRIAASSTQPRFCRSLPRVRSLPFPGAGEQKAYPEPSRRKEHPGIGRRTKKRGSSGGRAPSLPRRRRLGPARRRERPDSPRSRSSGTLSP